MPSEHPLLAGGALIMLQEPDLDMVLAVAVATGQCHRGHEQVEADVAFELLLMSLGAQVAYGFALRRGGARIHLKPLSRDEPLDSADLRLYGQIHVKLLARGKGVGADRAVSALGLRKPCGIEVMQGRCPKLREAWEEGLCTAVSAHAVHNAGVGTLHLVPAKCRIVARTHPHLDSRLDQSGCLIHDDVAGTHRRYAPDARKLHVDEELRL
mmetsp:Transcript_29506/g.64114  ORF Transcript_29506/g.64114 Transcript_29506/m.64114 type:complete len:211 (-) Transcript_29506:1288-1920(-)